MDINQRYPNLKVGIRTVKQPLFLCEPCRSFSSPSSCSSRAGSAGERSTSNGASSGASATGGGRRTNSTAASLSSSPSRSCLTSSRALCSSIASWSRSCVTRCGFSTRRERWSRSRRRGKAGVSVPSTSRRPRGRWRDSPVGPSLATIVIANARFFQMVQHAKEQWETAFDALSEGIAVVDDHGCISRANRALAAMLRAPLPAVIGRNLGEALLGPSPALLELLVAARQGDRVQPVVLRSTTLGRTIRVNAARIPAPAHDQSVVVLVEDVTDQQALEAQLIQSEKLAAVGQLVSGVAHELNNPLTSIAGLSEFLLEQQELGTKDRGHLRVIHEQADRAGRIVRNLLTFARKGPGEQAAVDLNDVIQRTLLLMSYDLKLKDVTIEKNLAPLPPVLGDRHALQQVVINLLNNAAQAVAENPPERPRVILLSTWVDDRVRMRVADSGSGIADAVLPHLFTPFFTTKEPGQGTGLGLSITYSIVEAHGGRIAVERPAEGGAAFLVDLPPAPAGVALHLTPVPEPAPAPPSAKRAILLVDDDP